VSRKFIISLLRIILIKNEVIQFFEMPKNNDMLRRMSFLGKIKRFSIGFCRIKSFLMMKNIYLPAVFICCLSLLITINVHSIAQVATCDSVNHELTSKFRFLGDWDFKGTPDYLQDESDDVSEALINYVTTTLPESVYLPNSNNEYFGEDVQLNTELTEESEVYLTMVHEGAGWKNSLGFYTYDVDNPPQSVYDIDSLVILFPNVSQPNVINPGDKILLGEFPANTGIGYFLIAQGWVGDTICLTSHLVFSDSHLNTFTTEEYQQQTILLNYELEEQLLLCFEDIQRPAGDNDFNDAVFYITANSGAIDTTNIPKIPTAMLSGDTTLCDEAGPAVITVELTGQAPWIIVYDDGIRKFKISDIEEEVFTFETMSKDTIKLVSVKDKNKFGIVSGEAIVQLSESKAILAEDNAICGGGDGNSGYIIELVGQAPFTLKFQVGDQEKTINNISTNKVEITGSIGEVVRLISMTDKYCDGEIIGGSAVVHSVENPDLIIDGNGSICGDALSTTFNLSLAGEGPWILNYNLGNENIALPIETNEYQLDISGQGELAFNSIEDENCLVTLASIYTIEQNPLPTASIDDFTDLCGEDEAKVAIGLTGSGPWIIHYKINDESLSTNSDEELVLLSVAQSGLFELIGVSDANCENTSEGSISLEISDLPTATISGDATLCNEDEASILIEMNGIAPFTIVYTDGETETEITVDENIYGFSSTEYKTFTLLSLSDANCNGVVDGSATISDGSEDIQVEIDAGDISCFGEKIELSLLGDTDNMSVTWTTEGNGMFENTDQLSTAYVPDENETGVIVFYAELNNGCAVKTVSKEVTIIEEIDASFDVSPGNDLLTETQITFTPSNNNYDEYLWDFGDENTSSATIASNEYIDGGKYTVELTVKIEGCEGSGTNDLEVLSKDELYVPNAFNPNAQNSENQVVKVYGNNVDEFGFSFKIVNRWGKVMYQTNSFSEANTVGWDGINNNNSEELELNVFTYVLKGQFLEGDSFERTGTVTQVK